MDAIKEYMRIVDKLEHDEITLEEYEKLCAPLRNVVEVVRCKDCINYKYIDNFGWSCCVFDWASKEDDYCSMFAERKEDVEK